MIVAKYKFDNTISVDYVPVFNEGYTYTKSDVVEGNITTRTIEGTELPTEMRFGVIDNASNESSSLLEVLDINISEITNMNNMFGRCSNLTKLDVSNWDVSNVVNMGYMFYLCSKLTSLDVSNWDTSNVTDICSMFSYCSKLTSLDVSNWDVSNVMNTNSTFRYCSSLVSLDMSNWDVSNVSNMSDIFNNCSNLKFLDISNFNTTKVINMANIFKNCSNLETLDLSNWNIDKVTNMSSMFEGCSSLTYLDISNFKISNTINVEEIFDDCTNLSFISLVETNEQSISTFISKLPKTQPITVYVSDTSSINSPSNVTLKKYEEQTQQLKLNSPLLEGDKIIQTKEGVWHYHKSELIISDDNKMVNYLEKPYYEKISDIPIVLNCNKGDILEIDLNNDTTTIINYHHPNNMITHEFEELESKGNIIELTETKEGKFQLSDIEGNYAINVANQEGYVYLSKEFTPTENNFIPLPYETEGRIRPQVEGRTLVNLCEQEEPIALSPTMGLYLEQNTMPLGLEKDGVIRPTIKGRTLVNVCDQKEPTPLTSSYSVENMNVIPFQDTEDWVVRPVIEGKTIVMKDTNELKSCFEENTVVIPQNLVTDRLVIDRNMAKRDYIYEIAVTLVAGRTYVLSATIETPSSLNEIDFKYMGDGSPIANIKSNESVQFTATKNSRIVLSTLEAGRHIISNIALVEWETKPIHNLFDLSTNHAGETYYEVDYHSVKSDKNLFNLYGSHNERFVGDTTSYEFVSVVDGKLETHTNIDVVMITGQAIKVKPDTVYTLSIGNIEPMNGSLGLVLAIATRDISWNIMNVVTDDSFSGQIQIPAGVEEVILGFASYSEEDYSFDSYCLVSDIQFEEGLVATPYAPYMDGTHKTHYLPRPLLEGNTIESVNGVTFLVERYEQVENVLEELQNPVYTLLEEKDLVINSYVNGNLYLNSDIPPKSVTFNGLYLLLSYLEPNSSYKLSFNSDKDIILKNCDLGGSSIQNKILRIGNNEFTFTMGDNPLTLIYFEGVGANISNVSVVKDVNCKYEYFEGTSSAFESELVTDTSDPNYGKYKVEYKTCVQLEVGNTATEYEPYKVDTKTYYLNSPLYEGDSIEMYSSGEVYHVRRFELEEPIYELLNPSETPLNVYANGQISFNTDIPPSEITSDALMLDLNYVEGQTNYNVSFNSDKETVINIILSNGEGIYDAPIVKGLNRLILTSGDPHHQLWISGIGANISNVQVIKENYEDYGYFKGLYSSYEDGLVTDENDPNYGKYKVEYKTCVQLEVGNTATEYEPYKETVKTYYLDTPLLQGDTIETINGKVYHIQRSRRIVLNENTWLGYEEAGGTYGTFTEIENYPGDEDTKEANPSYIFCDKLPTKNHYTEWSNSREGVHINYERLHLNLSYDKVSSVEETKQWLSENPLTIIYRLQTPIYHLLEGQEDPMKAIANGTFISNSIIRPKIEFKGLELPLNYEPTHPNIKYDALTEGEIIERISDNKLILSGIGKVRKVMVIDSSDNTIDYEYFNGMRLSYDENKITYKNLFNGEMTMGGFNYGNGQEDVYNDRYRSDYIEVKHNTQYVMTQGNQYYAILEYDKDKNFIKTTQSNKLTTSSETKYIRIVNDITENIQIEEGNVSTDFEIFDMPNKNKIKIELVSYNTPMRFGKDGRK